MFKAGDYVVKANTGICVVVGIVTKRLTEGSPEKEYYLLSPLGDPRSRLFVPVSCGVPTLRKAMDSDEALCLIRSIPEIDECWIENDRLREQKYKEVIRSNDPVALVGIIKNLYSRSNKRIEEGKKVTVVDDRYFKMAEGTLYTELAHALDKDPDEMQDIISEVIESA